jgi:ATP-dependent Clp protease ATP-binding subunit ClpC
MTMSEPFTERARRSIMLAQEEAQRLGNNYIGTEHILLGIISEGESLANNAGDAARGPSRRRQMA